jgi:hypothetical protein
MLIRTLNDAGLQPRESRTAWRFPPTRHHGTVGLISRGTGRGSGGLRGG